MGWALLYISEPFSYHFTFIHFVLSIIESVSLCCSFFSVFGIPFLLILGVLFNSQPEFVVSTLTENEGREYARSCFVSALYYVVALVLSLIGIFYNSRRESRTVSHTTGDVGYMELPPMNLSQL